MKSPIRELADALHDLTLIGDGMGHPVDQDALSAAEERARTAFAAVADSSPATRGASS